MEPKYEIIQSYLNKLTVFSNIYEREEIRRNQIDTKLNLNEIFFQLNIKINVLMFQN